MVSGIFEFAWTDGICELELGCFKSVVVGNLSIDHGNLNVDHGNTMRCYR
jgi:hypothetical protein